MQKISLRSTRALGAAIAIAVVLLPMAGPLWAKPAPPATLATALAGRWTPDPGGECAQVFRFQLAGNTLRMTGPDGKVHEQRIIERRETGFAAETTTAFNDMPKGTKWVYEIEAPGELSVTGKNGESTGFQLCGK